MFNLDKTGSLIKKITEAIRDYYKSDPTIAGLTIAMLGDGKYYASITRYHRKIWWGKRSSG